MPFAVDITKSDLGTPWMSGVSLPRLKRQFLVIWDVGEGFQYTMPHGLPSRPDDVRISPFIFPGIGGSLFGLDRSLPVAWDATNIYFAKTMDTGAFGLVEVQINHSLER